MEKMKQNLHYIVFAVGILIGAVLVFVGITIRSDKEADLQRQLATLGGSRQAYTTADLRAIEQRRDAFDRQLEQTLNELRQGRGSALTARLDQQSDSRAFRAEAEQRMSSLRERFRALEMPIAMPETLSGWTFSPAVGTRQQEAWNAMQQEITAATTAEQVREHSMRLRVLEEICVVAERLVASGVYGRNGVRLISVAYERPSFAPLPNRPEDSPWEVLGYTMRIEAVPELAIAIMNELINPTELTAGGEGRQARRGFPNDLLAMTGAVSGRPLSARFEISDDMKARFNIPADLDPNSDQGRAERERVRRELDQTRPAMPLDFAIQLQAKAFNPRWRLVQEAEQN